MTLETQTEIQKINKMMRIAQCHNDVLYNDVLYNQVFYNHVLSNHLFYNDFLHYTVTKV